MEDRKKTELVPKDKLFFDNLGDVFASTEEKNFFENMKYKMEFEPAMSNDLIMSENDNEDGIYIVRCYDYEFIIGCHVGDTFKEEKYTMNFSDTLETNLKNCGFIDDNLTLLEWLRNRNFKGVQYDHNYDLM